MKDKTCHYKSVSGSATVILNIVFLFLSYFPCPRKSEMMHKEQEFHDIMSFRTSRNLPLYGTKRVSVHKEQ